MPIKWLNMHTNKINICNKRQATSCNHISINPVWKEGHRSKAPRGGALQIPPAPKHCQFAVFLLLPPFPSRVHEETRPHRAAGLDAPCRPTQYVISLLLMSVACSVPVCWVHVRFQGIVRSAVGKITTTHDLGTTEDGSSEEARGCTTATRKATSVSDKI